MANSPKLSPAARPFPIITLILIAINCIVFVFGESSGRNPSVVFRYSMIPREIMTGYKLTVDNDNCIHDQVQASAFRLPVPESTQYRGLGSDLVIAPGPHDVGCVPPDVAAEFRYRTLSPATTLFTNMFLHEGWWHLIGNMLFLYIFGSIVESVIGPWKYLLLYLSAGLLSGFGSALIVWAVWHLKSAQAITPGLGASGAIAGIIGSYLALHPKARISIPIPVGPILIPLGKQPGWVGWIFATLWGGNEIRTAVMGNGLAGGVNHLAHVAGFGAGILLVVMHESAQTIFIILYLIPMTWPLLREFLINRWGT
jgi:membrane associated rhomboid family serine protease